MIFQALRRISSLRPLAKTSYSQSPFHQVTLQQGLFSSFEFNSISDYDKVSNETLERLCEDVEAISDTPALPSGFDVELSVSVMLKYHYANFIVEWRPYYQAGGQGHFRHQQAASESADLAFVPHQV